MYFSLFIYLSLLSVCLSIYLAFFFLCRELYFSHQTKLFCLFVLSLSLSLGNSNMSREKLDKNLSPYSDGLWQKSDSETIATFPSKMLSVLPILASFSSSQSGRSRQPRLHTYQTSLFLSCSLSLSILSVWVCMCETVCVIKLLDRKIYCHFHFWGHFGIVIIIITFKINLKNK